MDYDRKSTVSSFYGGRKSHEALNSDFPSSRPVGGGGGGSGGGGSQQQYSTRDDASSFFQGGGGGHRGRTSADLIHVGQPSFGTAGYNRDSFIHTGRVEPLKGGGEDEEDEDEDEEGGGGGGGGGRRGRERRGGGGGPMAGQDDSGGVWDVYADFNNTGPRYSSAFGQTSEKGYQQLLPTTPRTAMMPGTGMNADGDPVEMVTVPALGTEWGREELKDMTKTARKEKKAEARRDKLKAWNRGERGMCGKYFTRRVFVFALFATCAVAAIIIGFTLPRVPAITISSGAALIPAKGALNDSIPTYFNRAPANFSFPAYVSLQVDTTSNYLPIQFNSIDSTVYDLITQRKVAHSRVGHRSLPAKKFPKMLLPLNFSYVATNTSDMTWSNWYNGCKNSALYPTGRRPPVQFQLVLEMSILGLPTSRRTTAQTSEAGCPIELSQSSS